VTHVTYRLTAKNRDQLLNPTLGNRVWATFTFLLIRWTETALCLRVVRPSVCACVNHCVVWRVSRALEYFVISENLSLSAIRTVRVLRPLRAINRIPSTSKNGLLSQYRVVHGLGWPIGFVGLSWVGLGRVGSRFFSFCGLGWVHYSKSTKNWKDYFNAFKARLDKIWLHQAVEFDFVAGQESWSEGVIKW